MKTFKDNQDREWQVAVNVATVKRVRDLLKVNLLDAVDESGGVLARLAADPVLLVDVLYVLCREQAEARSVTDEAFGRSLAGDAVERATAALRDEVIDFFPSARRTLLRKVAEKADALAERIGREAIGRVDAIDLDALAATAFSTSATSRPGSSASTPAPSPSGSSA